MKKGIIVLLLAVSFLFLGTQFVQGQEFEMQESCDLVRDVTYNGNSYSGTVDYSDNEGAGAVVCMINSINRAVQIIFFVMMAAVVILVVIGGAMILMGGQNPENVEKGKKYITYAIIGVVIGILAYVVPWIINLIVG